MAASSQNKNVDVLLSTIAQLKIQNFACESEKQQRDDVMVSMLSNGILSCNNVKEGSKVNAFNLTESDSILIAKNSINMEFGTKKSRLTFSNKETAEKWYNLIVETLNGIGHNFGMTVGLSRRRVASERLIRPKSSVRRKVVTWYQDAHHYEPVYESIKTDARSNFNDIAKENLNDFVLENQNTYINENADEPVESTDGKELTTSLEPNEYSDNVNNTFPEPSTQVKDMQRVLKRTNAFPKKIKNICQPISYQCDEYEIKVPNKKDMKQMWQTKQKQTIEVKTKKLEGSIDLFVIKGTVVIAKVDSSLNNTFYEGDIITTINGLSIESVQDFWTNIRRVVSDQVTLGIVRFPYAEIVIIERDDTDTDLGFKLDKRQVVSVDIDGLAEMAGLKIETMKATEFGTTTKTCVTAINGFPLDQHCTEEQTMELMSINRDVVTLVVQPHDYIKRLQQE